MGHQFNYNYHNLYENKKKSYRCNKIIKTQNKASDYHLSKFDRSAVVFFTFLVRNLNLGLSYLITTYLQVVVEPYHHPFQNDEFLDLTNYLCPEAIEKTWPQLKLGSEKVHHTSLFWLTFCKSMEEFCQQHRSFCKNKVYYQVKTFSNWKDRRNIKVHIRQTYV